MLTWVAVIIVILCAWLGVALVAVTLPGIWFAVLAALLIEVWRPEVMSTWVLITAVVIALLAEVVEFASSAAGSRRAGGSRSGGWGALFGTVVGLIAGQIIVPIPILGAILGGIVGAGLGAVFTERSVAKRTWSDSWRSGRGAAQGRAFSMVLKTAMGAVVALLLTADAVASLF
tara:strand:- start:14689 stop:15210 length:522 start_codon:yes stop_codon:yes gene_type:complete